MKLYKFEGDWESKYQFDAFKGLQSREGVNKSKEANKGSDGTVRLLITDELDDSVDPKQEQINAINYIIDNPKEIQKTLFKTLELEYPKLKEMYGYSEDDEDSLEWFPKVQSIGDFRNVFGVGNMFVTIESKNGFSYVGLECRCTWDEEHGLGFLLHKNRLIKVGGADVAFNSWETYKDNGTYEDVRKEIEYRAKNIEKIRQSLPKPIRYKPNSKYGKLKPSQIRANKMYENNLIERGYNEEFIELVESNKIDIDVNPGLSMTFLERAAQFNNLEIVKYILSKNPKVKKNVIHRSLGYCNRDLVNLLLNSGTDINELDDSGRTLLKATEIRIKYESRRNGGNKIKYEEFEKWLKTKGATF